MTEYPEFNLTVIRCADGHYEWVAWVDTDALSSAFGPPEESCDEDESP